MYNFLRLSAAGLILITILEAIIRTIDVGAVSMTIQIPKILLASGLSYFLCIGRKWASFLVGAFLTYTIIGTVIGVLYIGGTSSLYPEWKTTSYEIMGAIATGSLICLILHKKRDPSRVKPGS